MSRKWTHQTAAGIGALVAASVLPLSLATPAHAEQGASLSCSSPSGNKSNYSWENGNISTTVYFNNHCSHKVNAQLRIFDSEIGGAYYECLSTNGGTKGKKKFNIGATGSITKITRGC